MLQQPLFQLGQQLIHIEQLLVSQKMEESFTHPITQMAKPTLHAQLTFAMVLLLVETTLMQQHYSIHISWDASDQDQTSLECTNNVQPIQEHAE